MTTNLAKQKENLEAYIRSTGYNTRGMNVENNHVLIEKPILDSYENEHQRKELVDLVNVIETRTRGGKYEVTDFESDSLQEVSENSVERTEADKKKTISVDYLVKLFSGKLDFSQEQLDDGQYYNGRVLFKDDCMGEWYPGKDCRVKSFDTAKTSWNARYAVHDAPKKYQEGMKLKAEDGYLNSDVVTEKKENETHPEEPKKPDTPKNPNGKKDHEGSKKPDTPKASDEKKISEESKKPEKQDETTKKENSGDSRESEKTDKKRNNVSVLATEKTTEDGNNSDTENDTKTEIEVENEVGTISQDDKDQSKEIGNKNDSSLNEVPKLGEIKKENTGISLWWAWFIGGTVLGATLHKIFFSIRSKKKSISN